MRLRNHTDIPSALIRRMIDFARPPGIAGFDMLVSNRADVNCYRARAYPEGVGYQDRDCLFAVASVGRVYTPRRRGSLPMPALTRAEAALLVLAHELRHLWQGKRGQFSDRDAHAYALRILRRWRREGGAEERAARRAGRKK